MLFDVDATLLTTSHAGVIAMREAGRRHFGTKFSTEGVRFAGGLDPVLLRELLGANGVETTDENLDAIRKTYAHNLGEALETPGVARALPGVYELLDTLETRKDVTLGLLTGNFPDTGAAKLQAAGIDIKRFHVRVWGTDSPYPKPVREHLPGVAMERAQAYSQKQQPPERTVVIGDTPRDVACAKAHGCRCLGVGTGPFTTEQLVEAGADHAVQSLAETRTIADWLTGTA